MSNFQAFQSTTKVEGQHDDVFPGSPMALVAVFTKVLQARFSGDNAVNSPYAWAADAQPLPATEGVTRIYIESQYTEDPDARDQVPCLLVEKGTTLPLDITIGNRANIDLPTMAEFFVMWAKVPMSVLCIATKRGISAVLADVAWAFFLGSRDHIRRAFGIHALSMPTLSDTQPYRPTSNNVDLWATTVSFEATIQFMWATKPIAPVLQEISATMDYGNGDKRDLLALDLRKRR